MTATPGALPAPLGTSDERSMLEGFLEQYRAIVARKATGLSDEQAREVLVSSGTSVAGLMRHLRWVEEAWFVEVLTGGERPAWRDDAPQRQFEAGEEPLQALVEAYRASCERSRTIAAQHDLEDTGRHPRLGEVSLRWIYIHMIEELARHAGHLDILREQLDETVGFD